MSKNRDWNDVQPRGVKLYLHPDTKTYQDPRNGTVGCPVGPTGATGATGPNIEEKEAVEEMEEMEVAEKKSAEVQLTVEERQRVENLALQSANITLRKELFVSRAQQQINEFDAALGELQAKINQAKQELSAKYGIDFSQSQIEAGTGRVIPAPTKE